MVHKLLELFITAAHHLAQNLPGLAGLVLVMVLFVCAGAAICRSRVAILLAACGWAMGLLLAALLPLACLRDLRIVAAILLIAAAIGGWRLWKTSLDTRALLPCLLLGIPLLLLSAVMRSTYFDAYLHWLPNAHYLADTDQLISQPLPPGFYSMHETYPPTLALPVYLASRFIGQFAVGAAQCLASVLLVLTAQFIVVVIEVDRPNDGQPARRWGLALFALAALVLLNPAIHNFEHWPAMQSAHYWSAIADPALGGIVTVALMTSALHLSTASAERAPESRRGLLMALFALGALIATLKPSGTILATVIAIAILTVCFVSGLNRRAALASSLWLGCGAVVAALAWKFYMQHYLPVADDLGLRDLSRWRFDLLPPLLRSWRTVAARNFLFYGLGIAALVLGLMALRRRQAAAAPRVVEVLAATSGLAFLGHLATLLLAYLGVGLEEWAVRLADSVQRYSAQVGLASCTAALLLLGPALGEWRRVLPNVHGGGVPGAWFAALVALFYLPIALSASGNMLTYQKERFEQQALALATLDALPDHARVAIAGDIWSIIFARYSAWADFKPEERPWPAQISRIDGRDDLPRAKADLDRWMNDPAIDCVLLLNSSELAAMVGLPALPDHQWCRDQSRWIVLSLGRQQRQGWQ